VEAPLEVIVPRTVQKILFTVLALGLLAAHVRWPTLFPANSLTLVLLTLAVLPWLDTLVKAAELPGGWKIEFRELQEKVSRQQDVINALVKYSMSASIFHHLCGLALLRVYRYVDNETNRREFYFLRDNGFIQPRPGIDFVDFSPEVDGRNLVELAEPTPIGRECVRFRQSEIPSNMRSDVSNLRVSLDTL
jgi:hypothetical protein